MNAPTLPEPAWLAAYLFYQDPGRPFLCQAVAPFVRQILSRRLASGYFFIRYWERGPHIRLRFQGHPEVLEKEVKPALTAYFSAYFAAYPSVRPDPPWLQEAPQDQQWHQNNSIQFTGYEPETERYGGKAGLLIAERQFEASSEAVLALLQEKEDWDYSRALGVAIQLHVSFAFASGMDLTETGAFFAQVFNNWLPRAYFPYQQDLPAGVLMARRQEVLQAFARMYEKQKAFLLPLFRRIWEALENRTAFDQAWYNQWFAQMQGIHKDLRRVQAEGQLLLPGSYTGQAAAAIAPENQQRWAIYDSYIHMTNNRLGILNRDEGYLGYLIKEGLADLALSIV